METPKPTDTASVSVKPGESITIEHVEHLEKFMAAAKAVYDEIMGQSAHERLQIARQSLHQVFTDGVPALKALEAEIKAVRDAAVAAATEAPASVPEVKERVQ